MSLLADRTVLVGTVSRLAESLGTSASDLRSSLRILLENGRIALHVGPYGQVAIRLERRSRQSAAPQVQHRRPTPDIWVS